MSKFKMKKDNTFVNRMVRAETLKPFCGGEAIINEIEPHTHQIATFMPDYSGSCFIECTGCSCAIAEDTIKKAIAAWNRRFYYGKNYKKRNSRV